MAEHLGAAIDDAPVLDDQIVGTCRHHLLDREPRQHRPIERGGEVAQPHAPHHLVNERAGAGEIAAPLIISGDPRGTQPGNGGQPGVHAPDQRLAPAGVADLPGDHADLRDDFAIARCRGQLDDPDPPPTDRRQRVAAIAEADQDQVGAEQQHILGIAARDRERPRLARREGHGGIAGEAAQRGDLPRIGEREQILIGAQVQAHDPAWPRMRALTPGLSKGG
jgi:hypothetical protein